MKMKPKKFACLILTLVLLLGVLAGCGEQQQSSADASDEAEQSVISAAEVETETPETDEPEETDAADNKIVFPLEEPVNFKICVPIAPFAGQYVNELTDLTVYREMEKRTNVIFDGLMMQASAAVETVNTIIAGGDYPDVFPGLDSYSSKGALQNYMDDVIIDLSDYIEEYAPDMQEYLSPEVKLKISFEVDGEEVILGFPSVNKEAITSNISGMQYRGDWLEEAGLSVPKTLSEFTEVVKAFKVNHDATLFIGTTPTALPIATALDIYCATGQQSTSLTLPSMYKDGEVVAGFMQDEFYTYLQYASEWYQEGYIDQDFMSGETTADNATGQIINGEIGIYRAGISSYSLVNSTFEEEGSGGKIVGGSVIIGDDAEDTHVGEPKSLSRSMPWCVSSACEHPEIITAWVNYLFTDEGFLLTNYGVEGEALQYNENGEPELSDLVLNNPDGAPIICMEYVYCRNEASTMPGILYMDKNLRLNSEDALAAYQVWKTETGGSDWRIPRTVQLSSDEADVVNSYIGDLSTYYDEMILRFVVEKDTLTEESFNEFRDKLVELGINEVLEAYQSAVERYYTRLAAMS